MIQADFTISPLSGDVLATKFTFTDATTGASVYKYVWDPGLGKLIYNIKNPTVVYTYPGTYTVSLTATDYNGSASTKTKQLSVDYVFRDYITFTQIPEKYSDPGLRTATPFKINVLTTNIDKPIIIDLFAANSRSTPYNFVPTKWNFLTPTWYFLDNNSNIVTSLSVESKPVYKNGTVVAVSGTTEFYYVDSMSTGNPATDCPILITATLQTSGFNYPHDSNIYTYDSYVNNETVRAGVVWQVNDLFPNLLKVTSNYIENIPSKQWRDIKIPTLITCHSNRSLLLSGSEDTTSGVIFSYPSTNAIGNIAPLTLTLSNVLSTHYVVDDAPLYFKAVDANNSRAGGYIFTTTTALTTITSTEINAQTVASTGDIYDTNKFIYPKGFVPNTPVWVANPEKNTLNKITLVPDPGTCNTINYFKEKKILTDGYIKEVQVPALISDNTFNYEMSGFSGIYGMAIDPRNYDLIACDAELDRLYRFANDGSIITTFELSSLNDYNPEKKLLDSWSWKTSTPYASATSYSFYGPVIRSSNPANYILVLGGLIQPASFIQITPQKSIRIVSTVPGDFGGYPPENVTLDVIQLFSPSLPNSYIDNIKYWVFDTTVPTTTFSLTGTTLTNTPANYIVTVDGVLQRQTSYNIDSATNTLIFNEPVPEGITVYIHFLPDIQSPATWSITPTTSTNFVTLTGNENYKKDKESGFLVNIGGVLQSQSKYSYNYEQDTIVFDTQLPLNVPIEITQISVPEKINNRASYTPSYVSLDKDSNIWVSLFNTVSVLKFDPNFNLLFSTAPTKIGWPTRSWTNAPQGIDYQSDLFEQYTRYVSISGLTEDFYYEEYFLKPPVVETDRENNCWVTYANPLCSMLVKYDRNGQALTEISLPLYTTPINLAVNADNNVWVANMHGSSYTYTTLSGSIVLYDSETATPLKTITGVSRPGYIALDRSNNLWFTHSTRRIGYYDVQTDTLSSWTLDLTGGFTPFVMSSSDMLSGLKTFDSDENQQDEELGGLAVDVHDRVWVIDTLQNYAWVLSATPFFDQKAVRYFKIVPDSNIGYYTDINDGSTYTETGDYYYRSAQATGDWTGNRWYQKYVTAQLLSSVAISGVSTSFNVTPFENENQIRRVNESFNTAEYYKALAIPENLKSNTNLFDKFFSAAVGTGYLSANEDLGQTVYERIANFTINHSDIDTCNISQLLSLADQTGTPASDYSAIYPTDIRNFLDVASTPRPKLWGIEDKTPLFPQSIGERYNTQTDYLTANTKIVLKNKFDSKITLVTVPPYNGQDIYPITQFKGYGFIQPVTANYLFYHFTPVYNGNYIENIIDWQSEFTTLNPTLSTYEEWYGDDGIIENTFRYLLTKNLFLK